MPANAKIPEQLSPLFWDVHLEEVDAQQHRIFIIERVLNEGDHHAVRWLRETYTEGELREAVMSARSLDKKTARYWQCYFGLSEGEMRCFGVFSTGIANPF